MYSETFLTHFFAGVSVSRIHENCSDYAQRENGHSLWQDTRILQRPLQEVVTFFILDVHYKEFLVIKFVFPQ